MSTSRTHDRGLAAVARVRSVRETDSRLGLQHVLAQEAGIRGRLDGLEASLAGAGTAAVTTPTALLAQRTTLAGIGVLIGESREALATAVVLTADARARWTSDRARLAAVEQLLERRAARRRTEADRRAAHEADDLAAQRWARARGGVDR